MKAGVIGCGLIGQKRAAALPKSVQLVGCYDSDEAAAGKFAGRFNTKSYENVRSLLSEKELDFVIIATRHDSLATISLAALKAGKHVFVEKPGAINYEEFLQVFQAANSNGLKVHVGYNHRYHPGIIKAHQIYKQGLIGDLMFVRGRYGHGGRIGYEKEWRAEKSKSGGGELIDQGSHLIELSIGFLGELELQYGETANFFWDMPVEDNVFISLKNKKGNIAFLQASCTEWKNMFSLEIYGRNGKLDITGLGKSYGEETLTFHEMLPEMGPPKSKIWSFPEIDRSWDLELEEFVKDLIDGTSVSDNTGSSLDVLRIIGEIYSGDAK
jgi:predicted dehydrogenase